MVVTVSFLAVAGCTIAHVPILALFSIQRHLTVRLKEIALRAALIDRSN